MAEGTTGYRERIRQVNSYAGQLRKALPEVMDGFTSLHKASVKDQALDRKTKELIALGISVADRCDDCIAFHVNGALEAGASHEEIMEALGVAVFMGGGPALMYATHALEAAEELRK